MKGLPKAENRKIQVKKIVSRVKIRQHGNIYHPKKRMTRELCQEDILMFYRTVQFASMLEISAIRFLKIFGNF